MKIKVSETTNTQLDWLVAKCEGINITFGEHGPSGQWGMYSTNWSQGGPIIEREKLSASFCQAPNALGGDCWIATYPAWPAKEGAVWAEGPTPLIAAMRCYVANTLGEEVEVPDELIAALEVTC